MPPKDSLIEYKYDELKGKVDDLSEDVKRILTNHLPHLQLDMTAVRTEQRVLAALNIGAIIIGIIVTNFILK